MSGLEGLAVAASIIQVADAGLRISQTVYAYAESVRSADKRLKDVAIDVRVTSDIVRHVAELFDDFGKHVGPKELQTANECVNRCKAAFKEVEEYANKAKVSKWRFPLRERKLELMDAKLEQLKTSLHIMLTVIQNKNELKIAVERKSTRMTTQDEQLLKDIEALRKAKEVSDTRYDELQKNFDRLVQSFQPYNPQGPGTPASFSSSQTKLNDNTNTLTNSAGTDGTPEKPPGKLPEQEEFANLPSVEGNTKNNAPDVTEEYTFPEFHGFGFSLDPLSGPQATLFNAHAIYGSSVSASKQPTRNARVTLDDLEECRGYINDLLDCITFMQISLRDGASSTLPEMQLARLIEQYEMSSHLLEKVVTKDFSNPCKRLTTWHESMAGKDLSFANPLSPQPNAESYPLRYYKKTQAVLSYEMVASRSESRRMTSETSLTRSSNIKMCARCRAKRLPCDSHAPCAVCKIEGFECYGMGTPQMPPSRGKTDMSCRDNRLSESSKRVSSSGPQPFDLNTTDGNLPRAHESFAGRSPSSRRDDLVPTLEGLEFSRRRAESGAVAAPWLSVNEPPLRSSTSSQQFVAECAVPMTCKAESQAPSSQRHGRASHAQTHRETTAERRFIRGYGSTMPPKNDIKAAQARVEEWVADTCDYHSSTDELNDKPWTSTEVAEYEREYERRAPSSDLDCEAAGSRRVPPTASEALSDTLFLYALSRMTERGDAREGSGDASATDDDDEQGHVSDDVSIGVVLAESERSMALSSSPEDAMSSSGNDSARFCDIYRQHENALEKDFSDSTSDGRQAAADDAELIEAVLSSLPESLVKQQEQMPSVATEFGSALADEVEWHESEENNVDTTVLGSVEGMLRAWTSVYD